jgi:predicted transposase YdaD
LMDTPFLRRIREEGRAEGREEGRAEGRAEAREALLMDTPFLRRIREEGRAEGRAEARAEAVLAARRRSILDVLVVRFDPPVSKYQQIERQLETITDEVHLAQLLAAAVRTESVADFQAAMGQGQRPNGPQ